MKKLYFIKSNTQFPCLTPEATLKETLRSLSLFVSEIVITTLSFLLSLFLSPPSKVQEPEFGHTLALAEFEVLKLPPALDPAEKVKVKSANSATTEPSFVAEEASFKSHKASIFFA